MCAHLFFINKKLEEKCLYYASSGAEAVAWPDLSYQAGTEAHPSLGEGAVCRTLGSDHRESNLAVSKSVPQLSFSG